MGKKSDAVLDADENPDEVMGALGFDDEPDDGEDPDDDAAEDGGDDDGEDEGDEPTLADVLAELRTLKRDNATLKREAAAARVAAKATRSEGGAAAGAGDGETVEQARERGKEEARLEYGIELAGASVRAALTGIVPEADLDDFVDDLRMENFVGEDGKPDRDAIRALKDRQAKITRRKPAARTGAARSTGTGGEKTKGQLMGETLSRLGL